MAFRKSCHASHVPSAYLARRIRSISWRLRSAIANMSADIDAARLLVYQAVWMKEQGLPTTRHTSTAKLFVTEMACRAASEAVLLHGGRGYSNQYPVEHLYGDIKGLQIYEGSSHIQRIVIARDVIGRE